MPCDYKKYPVDWKSRIRPAILSRANHRCELCDVPNYAVGYWNGSSFEPTGGSRMHDLAGSGQLSAKQAREIVKHCNEMCEYNLIMVVLTIGHMDHNIHNNDFINLKAMCQRCHNRHDAKHRAETRRKNRRQCQIQF
jgi:hypothetical protein